MASETFEFLMNIYKGGNIDRYNVPDGLIYDVIPARYSTSSKVIITFDEDEDFLNVLGIDDDDDMYAWRRFMGNYGYRDYDTYWAEDEWREGYVIQGFDESNKEKLNEILKYLNPRLQVNDENSSAIAKFLEKRFDRWVGNITSEYGQKNEDCKERAVQKELLLDTKNPFYKFGIKEISAHYKYETTVGVLIGWYKKLRAEDEDLKGMLTKLIATYDRNSSRGGWYELEYNVWCDDYDSEGFNRDVAWNLDKIMDQIEEEIEENPDTHQYDKLYATVANLGGFDKYIDIPEKNIRVKFDSLDAKTNKLEFKVEKPNGSMEKRSVDNIEDLNLSLYHPELFEHIKKIINKILYS
jgi:hypothetical protein